MTNSFRLPRRDAWRLLVLAAVLLAAAPAGAADYLRYLPADTRVVATVNVTAQPKKAQEAWKKLGQQLYKVHLTPELSDIEPPVSDVSSLTVAMPFAGWPGGMIIIRGKVEAKRFTDQMRKCARMSKGTIREIRPTRARPIPIFHRKVSDEAPLLPLPEKLALDVKKYTTGSDIYFAAMDEETFILTVSPPASLLTILQPPGETEILRAVSARPKTTRPRISASLLALLKKQDSRAWMSFVVMDNAMYPPLALLKPELNQVLQRWRHVVGAVREDKDVESKLVATGKDIEEAKELERYARENAEKLVVSMPRLSSVAEQKEVLAELAKSIQVSRKDEVVTVTAKISADRMRILFAAVRLAKD